MRRFVSEINGKTYHVVKMKNSAEAHTKGDSCDECALARSKMDAYNCVYNNTLKKHRCVIEIGETWAELKHTAMYAKEYFAND